MNHSLISRALTGLALCTCAAGAFAHDGHGLIGAHWHATDSLGFVVVAALAAAAVWLSRK